MSTTQSHEPENGDSIPLEIQNDQDKSTKKRKPIEFETEQSQQDPPKISRRWTEEEDQRLRTAIERFGEAKWRNIASFVGTRDHYQCLQRWTKILKPGLKKGNWSEEEDALLVYLVSKGFENWGKLASDMPGRTSKQCRERWCHHLDPSVVKTNFTPEEDEIIMRCHSEYGNKWARIAQNLPGRNENSVKIRYFALERSRKKGPGAQVIRNRVRDTRNALDILRHEHFLLSQPTLTPASTPPLPPSPLSLSPSEMPSTLHPSSSFSSSSSSNHPHPLFPLTPLLPLNTPSPRPPPPTSQPAPHPVSQTPLLPSHLPPSSSSSSSSSSPWTSSSSLSSSTLLPDDFSSSPFASLLSAASDSLPLPSISSSSSSLSSSISLATLSQLAQLQQQLIIQQYQQLISPSSVSPASTTPSSSPSTSNSTSPSTSPSPSPLPSPVSYQEQQQHLLQAFRSQFFPQLLQQQQTPPSPPSPTPPSPPSPSPPSPSPPKTSPSLSPSPSPSISPSSPSSFLLPFSSTPYTSFSPPSSSSVPLVSSSSTSLPLKHQQQQEEALLLLLSQLSAFPPSLLPTPSPTPPSQSSPSSSNNFPSFSPSSSSSTFSSLSSTSNPSLPPL